MGIFSFLFGRASRSSTADDRRRDFETRTQALKAATADTPYTSLVFDHLEPAIENYATTWANERQASRLAESAPSTGRAVAWKRASRAFLEASRRLHVLSAEVATRAMYLAAGLEPPIENRAGGAEAEARRLEMASEFGQIPARDVLKDFHDAAVAKLREGNVRLRIVSATPRGKESFEDEPTFIQGVLIAKLGYTFDDAEEFVMKLQQIGPRDVEPSMEFNSAVSIKMLLEKVELPVQLREQGPVASGGGNREAIPDRVRNEVWRRDAGKCVDCSSRERLEYDHIIPVSKGGANTARNIELRCETCNRRKGARI